MIKSKREKEPAKMNTTKKSSDVTSENVVGMIIERCRADFFKLDGDPVATRETEPNEFGAVFGIKLENGQEFSIQVNVLVRGKEDANT